jgi:IS30 family transposase
MTFKAIGNRVGKDPTTISKEVKKRIDIIPTVVVRKDQNGNPFIAVCPKLLKPPFVCNACSKARSACAFDRHLYRAKTAQDIYKELLTSSREGIPLNKEEFYEIDQVISRGIKDGQHLYHILQTNNLNISVPTAYRHLHKDYFSIAPIDLPRMVKFKPRAVKREAYVPKGVKVGRSYTEFCLYKEENDLVSWWEMDTVIGRIGGKTILTLNFFPGNFIFGLLLDNKSSVEVTSKINALKLRLIQAGKYFGELFPVIVTDNGGEFSNVFAIENNSENDRETLLFFCDPYQSSQKPHIEKNHTCFRDIVPKGTSFDRFSQESLDTIFSHVNSVKRKSLGGKSALDVFSFWHGIGTARLLNIAAIPPQAVMQSPKLLKSLGFTI